MFKKFVAVMMCVLLVAAVGCTGEQATSSKPQEEESSSQKAEPIVYTNPLTGISGYTEDISENRPVAVMINNIKVAQKVQTGLNAADIIYETEVEGGITRLMAVYQDIASVQQIGTVRSARYPYVDIAMGHDAVYLHCGQDGTYCAPHLKDIDHISIDSGNLGVRISNGLASEHTLYAYGSTVASGVQKKFNMAQSDVSNWQNFASEEETVTLTGGECGSVSVPFSTSYTTGFTYDPSAKTYTRLSGGNVCRDYRTGESISVKNVFVLLTSISDYPDGYHRKVELSGGDGYYITNGTYTHIKWTKGSASSPFKFTDTSGNEIKVSAGNSWVCIADKFTSQPVIQ